MQLINIPKITLFLTINHKYNQYLSSSLKHMLPLHFVRIEFNGSEFKFFRGTVSICFKLYLYVVTIDFKLNHNFPIF